MEIKPTLWLFIFLILCACKSNNQESKQLLEKAYLKQKDAIEMMENLEQTLQHSAHEKKDSLSKIVHELEEGLFAISGYKISQSGHEGHDHGNARVELSAEEIYNVQEELVKQLKAIQDLLEK